MKQYITFEEITKPKTLEIPKILAEYLENGFHWDALDVLELGLNDKYTSMINFVRKYMRYMHLSEIYNETTSIPNPFLINETEEKQKSNQLKQVEKVLKDINDIIDSFSFYKTKKEFIEENSLYGEYEHKKALRFENEEQLLLDNVYEVLKKAKKGKIGNPKNNYYVLSLIICTAITASLHSYLNQHAA